MSMDAVRNNIKISEMPTGKIAGNTDTQKNISIFPPNKTDTSKHFELMDPDEFVDFLLKNDPTIDFDELSEEEKAEKRKEKKLEIIIKMNPELANTKLDEKDKKMLIADHDITIRAARYAITSGMIDNIRELSNLSDAEISHIKYKALEKHIALNPDKELNRGEKWIIQRGDLLKSIAKANNMEELDLCNADNIYELMYKYLSDKEKKEGLSDYEKLEFEPLQVMFSDYNGDLKNLKMSQWGEGKFFEDIDDEGILKKTINRVKGNTLLVKLEKELQDLSPEEQQEKITWLLKDCANIDQYYRMTRDLGILQKKGLVDANALVNAHNEKASIQALASFASKEMDAKGQEIVGTEFARQAKMENSPITDKQVSGYMTNVIPEYEVEAQAPAAKAMIETKRDAAINATGQMISLLADDPAKSVYQFVLTDNEYLNNEQRMLIVGNVKDYAHPDRLEQLNQVATQCGYNYETGECLYSGNTYNSNESPFSFNGYDNYYSDPNYQAYIAAASQSFGEYSNNAFATNPINLQNTFIDYAIYTDMPEDLNDTKAVLAWMKENTSFEARKKAVGSINSPQVMENLIYAYGPEYLQKLTQGSESRNIFEQVFAHMKGSITEYTVIYEKMQSEKQGQV